MVHLVWTQLIDAPSQAKGGECREPEPCPDWGECGWNCLPRSGSSKSFARELLESYLSSYVLCPWVINLKNHLVENFPYTVFSFFWEQPTEKHNGIDLLRNTRQDHCRWISYVSDRLNEKEKQQFIYRLLAEGAHYLGMRVIMDNLLRTSVTNIFVLGRISPDSWPISVSFNHPSL